MPEALDNIKINKNYNFKKLTFMTIQNSKDIFLKLNLIKL